MTQDIKIESGIPKPNKRDRRGGKPRFPLDKMKVGDSFKLPWRDGDTLPRLKRRGYSAVASRRKVHPKERYTVLDLIEDGKEVVRIWRDPDKEEA